MLSASTRALRTVSAKRIAIPARSSKSSHTFSETWESKKKKFSKFTSFPIVCLAARPSTSTIYRSQASCRPTLPTLSSSSVQGMSSSTSPSLRIYKKFGKQSGWGLDTLKLVDCYNS